MKDYMMLFLGASYENLSPEEVQAKMGLWFAWGQKMEAAGILKGGEALTPHIQRISGPDRVVSDMPSIESKELVGGYYTVKASSFEEVQKIAQDYPDYDMGGTVEIREVMVFS